MSILKVFQASFSTEELIFEGNRLKLIDHTEAAVPIRATVIVSYCEQ